MKRHLIFIVMLVLLMGSVNVNAASVEEKDGKVAKVEESDEKILQQSEDGSYSETSSKKDLQKETSIKVKQQEKDIYKDIDGNVFLEVKEDYYMQGIEIKIYKGETEEELIANYNITPELSKAVVEYLNSSDIEYTVVYKTLDTVSVDKSSYSSSAVQSSSLISRSYYTGYNNNRYMVEYWSKGSQDTGLHNFASGANPKTYVQNLASASASMVVDGALTTISKPLGPLFTLLNVSADQVYGTGAYSHLIRLNESVIEKWTYIYWNNTYQLGCKSQSANLTWSHLFAVGVDVYSTASNPMYTVLTPAYSYPDVRALNFVMLGGYKECFDYQTFKISSTGNTYNFDSIGD